MRISSLRLAALTALLLAPLAGPTFAAVATGQAQPDMEKMAVPIAAEGPFQPTWESLERYEVPDWFRNAKFGIFVHWGPQTLAGAKDGSADGTKTGNWKDYAVAFRGEKFDAAHWAEMFRKSGAKYVVQVAEHHDGYALYDSSLTPWTSVKMAPKRDFVAELAAAVRKEGLVFGTSSHTEEYWWFYSDPPKKAPPAPLPGRPVPPQPDKEFLDWWYARLTEIVEKYQPQFMWFDWCIEQPAYEPYLRRFAAYYYNRAAEWKQGVVINYKYDAMPVKAAVLDISWNTSRFAWKPERINPTPWQFDTMSNRSYWFWRADMQMRPLAEMICEMADVVSKNGNYLLNFPPAPDGSLTPGQEEVLLGIGRWLAVNGEAIYGTRPWGVFGEGPTEGLGPKFQGNPPKAPWTPQDIRFTTKGDTLYAIVMAWPEDRKVTVKSLAADSPLAPREIKGVSLLGSAAPVQWKRTAEGLAVELPAQKPCDSAYVLKIEQH
jgi:alpha-L-fucosidase